MNGQAVPYPIESDSGRLQSAAGESSRPFGLRYAAQEQVYLLYLPCVLLVFGIVAWLFADDSTFVLSAGIGGAVASYIFIDILFRGAPLRLTTIYAMTLLLGYNLGAFNSWLTVDRAYLSLGEFFARDPEALARASGACLATAAVLLVAGQMWERPIFGQEFRLRFNRKTLPLVVGSTLLLAGAYATGEVGFMGIRQNTSGHLNPLTSLIMWWAIPAFAYSVCASFNTTGFRRWVIGVCTVLQCLALVPFGRRIFAFSLALAIIAARLGRYRSHMPMLKKFLLGTLALVAVIAASLVFLYLRVAGYEFHGKNASLKTRVETAVDIVQKRGPMELLSMMGTDASTRTFMLGYFSDLLDASQNSTPLLGEVMLYNLKLTVPSLISSDKLGAGNYGEEELVNMHWGFAYIDEANSLLTAGAADFGFLGVLVYPLIIVLLMRALLEWIQAAAPTYLAAIIALSFIYEFLQPEDLAIGYFIVARNALSVIALFYLLSLLPRFQLRPESFTTAEKISR
jgi:hypothetical protein